MKQISKRRKVYKNNSELRKKKVFEKRFFLRGRIPEPLKSLSKYKYFKGVFGHSELKNV